MASKYQEAQRTKQIDLIESTDIFDNSDGGGYFMGKPRDFVLNEPMSNLYPSIRTDAINYMNSNNISWWGGDKPSGHTLSSQIACLNHLFAIRDDRKAVLKLLNSVRDEFVDLLTLPCDRDKSYIGFEVVSGEDYLNEKQSTRGSNCTSIDALIYAIHRSGQRWIIPIEWKYTEHYPNFDKSNEDRSGVENRGLNGKGTERLNRYSLLINNSHQIKTLPNYKGSIYYQEPFYQLMRQTLWAEQVIAHKSSDLEPLKADNYLHLHIIPTENRDLLYKKYRVSNKGMEDSWRECLKDQGKYQIVDPRRLLSSLDERYADLKSYLNTRY